MSEAVVNALVERKAFGITLNRKRYSSSELDIYEASADTILNAITANPKWLVEAAEYLSIKGYGTEEDA